MTINTKDRANSIRSRFLVIAFITVVAIVILLFTVDKYEIPFTIIGLGLAIYIYYMLKRFMYIQYNDDGRIIQLRYFKLIPSTLDHHAIEIPKVGFAGYELKQSMMGLRNEIILKQKTKNGLAKYPPVSVTILNDVELRELQKSLSKLAGTI